MASAANISIRAGAAPPWRQVFSAHGRQNAAMASISRLCHGVSRCCQAIHRWAAMDMKATTAHSRASRTSRAPASCCAVDPRCATAVISTPPVSGGSARRRQACLPARPGWGCGRRSRSGLSMKPQRVDRHDGPVLRAREVGQAERVPHARCPRRRCRGPPRRRPAARRRPGAGSRSRPRVALVRGRTG